MGTSCFSIHVRGMSPETFRAAIEGLVRDADAAAYVSTAEGGWLAAYPSQEFVQNVAIEDVVETLNAEHTLLISLFDSDVFQYWYARDGEIVDAFNSCPDYFGEADECDLEAAGDPEMFTDLLDAPRIARLRELLKPRMIDGEDVGGAVPTFEDERVAEFGKILGLTGVLGSFDAIDAEPEEEGEHLPSPEHLRRVE